MEVKAAGVAPGGGAREGAAEVREVSPVPEVARPLYQSRKPRPPVPSSDLIPRVTWLPEATKGAGRKVPQKRPSCWAQVPDSGKDLQSIVPAAGAGCSRSKTQEGEGHSLALGT